VVVTFFMLSLSSFMMMVVVFSLVMMMMMVFFMFSFFTLAVMVVVFALMMTVFDQIVNQGLKFLIIYAGDNTHNVSLFCSIALEFLKFFFRVSYEAQFSRLTKREKKRVSFCALIYPRWQCRD